MDLRGGSGHRAAVFDTDRDAPGVCAVEVRRCDGVTSAVLVGDLDASSAPAIEAVLSDELHDRPDLLEVSLEGLEFLDSSGLRVLLLLHRNATHVGVPLRFVRPRGPVRQTLEFAKALDYLEIDS
jgi:anti-sigma B factor antagonist